MIHPSFTYLEWFCAVDVGENMEIDDPAIIMTHPYQERNEFAFVSDGFDDPTAGGFVNEF